MKKISIDEIISIVNANLDNAVITCAQIDDDLQSHGMDSISFIRVVVAIEEAFEVEIPDSYLLLSEINTISKIYNVLVELSY